LRGIEVTDETLATGLMIEKGPGGDYLVEDHSLRHMRSEFFVPKLANRDKRDALKPGSDALSRAKARAAELHRAQPPSRLDDDVRAAIIKRFKAKLTSSATGG
jgi:trimethylamine--corrinoid protein Co-methyltransferase